MSFTFSKRLLQLLSLQIALMASPAMAAQEVVVNVSAFEASVSVQALQDFGETGEATGLLRQMLARLTPDVRQQAQTLFATQIEVDPVRLSNFLYTSQGETLLKQLGQIFRSEAGNSGFSGLRAALYQAAHDPQGGLTISNVLKHVPGDRIRLNTSRLLELASAWQEIAGASSNFELPMPKVTPELLTRFPLAQQLALRNPGQYNWSQVPDLETTSGDRATLYVPDSLAGDQRSNALDAYPVIVIAHGLGGDRSSFTYLAEHFVSHGFVVVVPEHQLASQRFRLRGGERPILQADKLLEDDWAKKIGPDDFIQRPRTVTRLLDALEKRQQQDSSLQGRVDLSRVGVLGQSFGGYASLSLGGAEIDLEELAQHCPADAKTFNPSLALQCRASSLGEDQTDHRDPRVKAIAAINPVGSALFGPAGMAKIQVPVLMLAGNHDMVTPLHAEQLLPFQWLTNQHRYFALLRGGTHFSVIQASGSSGSLFSFKDEGEQPQMKELALTKPGHGGVGQPHQQAQGYLKASSLAFFQTHLVGNSDYAKFLTPEFAALLSQGKDMQFGLAQELEI